MQSENLYNNQIEAYIQFYNEIRLHQSLKFKTPQAFEGIYREHFVKKKCSNNDLVQILLFSILGVLWTRIHGAKLRKPWYTDTFQVNKPAF